MLTYIVLVVIGMFIGWNLPQPLFAQKAQVAIEIWAKALWQRWGK